VNSRNKIVGLKKLKGIIQRLRRKGQTIAFTNGCFDLLHIGHVSYLEAAKGNKRVLIIGMNSDASVRKIKGKDRPIVSQQERSRVLASLGCVDYVTIFNDETPLNVIKTLRPDVLIKGADWKTKEVVGAREVVATGGKVEFIKYLDNFSTTNLIKKIQGMCVS